MSIDLSDIFALLVLIFIFYSFKEYLKESKSEVSWLKKFSKVGALFSLNDSGLSKQPIFWIGVITPLILSSYMEYLILTVTDVPLTIQNVSCLFELSKVPLYITALTPTFGIFIANIHRSIQTKKQIDTSLTQINISNNQYATALDQFRIAEKKNLSDGFYAHYKYISDELKNIVLREKKDSAYKSLSEKKIVVTRPHALYKRIFPNSNMKLGFNNTVSDVFIRNLTKRVKGAVDNLEIEDASLYIIYAEGGEAEINARIQKLNVNIMNILEYLYSDCMDNHYIQPSYKNVKTDGKDVKQFSTINTLYEIGWGMRKAYDFIVSILDIIGITLSNHNLLEKELNRYFKLISVNGSAREKYVKISRSKK
ncbi:hypothetical protein MKT61_004755 [Providencia rettgeri]|nr:hypothetical protein [Providencia rettgeri]